MLDLRQDWTQGIRTIQYLSCGRCGAVYYNSVFSCPECGGPLHISNSTGKGQCIAVTFVPARYNLEGVDNWFCIVKLEEGFRALVRGGDQLRVGDQVKIDFGGSAGKEVLPCAVRVAVL